MKRTFSGFTPTEEEFISVFDSMCPGKQALEKWELLMDVIACTLSNGIEPDRNRRKEREEEFNAAMKRLGDDKDSVVKLFANIVKALTEKPCEDYLGKLYMALNLGNCSRNQYFTPTAVAEIMARATLDRDVQEQIEREPYKYISFQDPSCGAGVTLIAMAKILKEQGVDYQANCLFVGQDIDKVVAQMCYIQLSLIGVAGYVCVGDTLENPIVCKKNLLPIEQKKQSFWFTPAYYSNIWQLRVFLENLECLTVPRKAKDDESKIAS